MTTTNEMAEAVARALEKAEREKNLSPVQRMAAGYEQSEHSFQEALRAEERLAGRPLERHEQRAVRRSLDGDHR